MRHSPHRAVLRPLAVVAVASCARKKSNQYADNVWQMESDNPWRLAATKSLEDEVAKRGIQLVVTDAQGQVADVEDLIARHLNLILLAPREYERLGPALQAAKIPVILVDRVAAGKPDEIYVTVAVSDQVDEGRRAPKWLAGQITGGSSIVELAGISSGAGQVLSIDGGK